MLPEARHEQLLYASVQTTCCAKSGADVYVFSREKGKLVGELRVTQDTMFGLCSDAEGDAFVTAFDTSTSGQSTYIYEYKHGEARLAAKLYDPWAADACAVDPVTGNLAVANWFTGGTEQSGNVLVYDVASGKYTAYSGGTPIDYYRWCTYDTKGNLYVDGDSNPSGKVSLAVLRKGHDSFSSVSLNTSDFLPYSLQWYNDDLVIAGDEESIGPETLLEVQVKGTTGTIVGKTTLEDYGHNWGDDSQFFIDGTRVISGGYPGNLLHGWRFPQGGHPLRRFAQAPDGWWYGVTVSIAPQPTRG
jgi:hypothetical protein